MVVAHTHGHDDHVAGDDHAALEEMGDDFPRTVFDDFILEPRIPRSG